MCGADAQEVAVPKIHCLSDVPVVRARQWSLDTPGTHKPYVEANANFAFDAKEC